MDREGFPSDYSEQPLPEGVATAAISAELSGRPVTVWYHAAPLALLHTEDGHDYFQAMLARNSLHALKGVLVAHRRYMHRPGEHLVWADSHYALEPQLLGQIVARDDVLAEMSSELTRNQITGMERTVTVSASRENIGHAMVLAAFLSDVAGYEISEIKAEIILPNGAREPYMPNR